MACQSTGDRRAGTRRYRQQFRVHDIPDDDEDPVSLVAPASCWLRVNQWQRNGKTMVYNLPGLVSEGNRVEDWRCETLPTGSTVLFGTHLRGLHARMCLEPHRTGAGDTNLYCMALRCSIFGIVFRDNVRLFFVFRYLKYLLNSSFEIFVSLLFSDF